MVSNTRNKHAGEVVVLARPPSLERWRQEEEELRSLNTVSSRKARAMLRLTPQSNKLVRETNLRFQIVF